MDHLEILRQQHVFLKDQLDVSEILDQLYQDGVFSHSDLDDCKAKQGRSAQCEELLSILKRKGSKGYHKFVQILKKHQPHIKKRLESDDERTSSEATSTPISSTVDRRKNVSQERDVAAELYRLQQEVLKLREEKDTTQRELDHLQMKVESLEEHILSHEDTIDKLNTTLRQDVKTKNDLKREVALQKQNAEQYHKTVKSLEKNVEDYSNTVVELQLTLGELGISSYTTYHRLSGDGVRKPIILKCIQLKFDRDRVNINTTHITTDGELVNTAQPAPHDHSKVRLVKYEGTTSTVPLPRCGSPQYWEVRGRVVIDKTLTVNDLLLEIGLCVEEERDQHHCIGARPHSYSLNVSLCPTHSSICRSVWKHGKHVLCLPDTLPNTPGHTTTLQFGVVLTDTRCRVVFIDLNTNKVMSVIDEVDCSRPLWPMFGTYNPHLASVSLSLVVGNDIDMTEEKKVMILKSLS